MLLAWTGYRCSLVEGLSWHFQLAAVLLLAMSAPASAYQDDAVREALRGRVERLRESGQLEVREARIASPVALPMFYEQRAFQPAWMDARAVTQLLRAIDDAASDGLDPEDYHRSIILRTQREVARSAADSAERLADLDLLFTDALVLLKYHLLFGKVDPVRLDPNWNFTGEIPDLRPAEIERMLASGDVHGALERDKPDHPYYAGLKQALLRYRAIDTAGGWPTVAAGPVLRQGTPDRRIPVLRQRLRITNDLPAAAADTSTSYDASLAVAVRNFQRRLGLVDDGVLGAGTLAQLNVPVRKRIEQLRLNLERARWVLHHLDTTFVVVNVAGYSVTFVRGGRPVWRSRAVVGLPYRRTPVFRDSISYLEFNPTWTVPPGILGREMLPRLKRGGPAALPEGMRVLTRSGRAAATSGIDWSRYTSANFPFMLRQSPGPNNPLGRVKFMFPNRYLVYLHDTPTRERFDETARAFSSGCIRIERPFELAELLLADAGWSRDSIDRAVQTGRTRAVYLRRKIPVLLLYWTAWVDEDQRLNFRPDVYGRDARLATALEEHFRSDGRRSGRRRLSRAREPGDAATHTIQEGS